MTPDEARQAIYDTFRDEWTGTDVVRYEGEPGGEPAPGTPWVRVSVRNIGGGQLSLGPTGGRKYDREISVFVQVFTPASRGMQAGATLAHAARAIFEGRNVNGVHFFDGTTSELPLGTAERSHQVNVEVRGVYEEIK